MDSTLAAGRAARRARPLAGWRYRRGVSIPGHGPIRAGHEDRERAVRALGEAFAQGRLEVDEFDERTAAAYAARTLDELDGLLADLWPPAPPPAFPLQARPPLPPVPAPPGPYPRYGYHPVTAVPYSDRSKVVAGILQLVLPFGVGRFYTGHTGIAVAQLILAFFFIGLVWSFIDGIVLLAGNPTDPYGRPLRP